MRLGGKDRNMQSKEFFINSDGIRLHTKLDRPEGMEKGPLCILIHGFTGDMEEHAGGIYFGPTEGEFPGK